MTTACLPDVTAAFLPRETTSGGRPRGLTFCDLSAFYAPTGGGIRTYHRAKLDWFSAQTHHRYVLVHPGPSFDVQRLSASASVVSVYGVPTRAAYRLPLDFGRIREVVQATRPDVLETGDPWVSGPLGLLFRQLGDARCVSSFFHADPMPAYVEPWVARGTWLDAVRARIGSGFDRGFSRVQRMYDVTLTSSAWGERRLRRRGVHRVLRVSFGADPAFFAVGRARTPRLRRRLLYAGRLQEDKGIRVLIDAIPSLLRRPNVTLTIVGVGPAADQLQRLASPRVRLAGHIASREDMARVYDAHDVLLAPGPNETFGLAALEGLASGLAVVAPEAGGAFEIVRQLPSPHVFRPDDAMDFVRAVEDALAADPAADTRAGLMVAERYGTWRDAIDRQVDSYCMYLSRCTT